MMKDSVFDEIKDLVTEARNPASEEIDDKSTLEVLQIINWEDQKVPKVIEAEIPYIAKAVDLLVDIFKKGGRLFYIGAGSSGRLGVLDAAECPPTYGTDPRMIQGIIAGGEKALTRAQEGYEDKPELGARDLLDREVTEKDVPVNNQVYRVKSYRAMATAVKTGTFTSGPISMVMAFGR
ncbi:MAG: N-acetylmuramic acid 6-phosphate etherase, partial [Bacteroidales bacterium]|nr:N-acetylmuramic acid 6-phosphate etherase [Bacteroidales bacterium]